MKPLHNEGAEVPKSDNELKAFLLWMNRNNICSVIPFIAQMDGRNGNIPHWSNGKKLFDASELIQEYRNK